MLKRTIFYSVIQQIIILFTILLKEGQISLLYYINISFSFALLVFLSGVILYLVHSKLEQFDDNKVRLAYIYTPMLISSLLTLALSLISLLIYSL